jgi:ATP-binding cassette subfamily F protein uup
MDRLVDHLFVFEGDGEVRDFPGTYTQYRIWLKENEKKDNKWQALEQHKSTGKSLEEDAKQVSQIQQTQLPQNVSQALKKKESLKN